jgi:hypothetical protein
MDTITTETPTVAGAPFAGGFYAGRILIAGALYAIVVAPKAGGVHKATPLGPTKNVPGALSFFDGQANTVALAKAGSKLAKWAHGLEIGGFTDWYLPSRDELEICYRAFKPTQEENYCWRGDNPSSVPPGYAYSLADPLQTTVEAFQAEEAEAFEPVWYWSSTQSAGTRAPRGSRPSATAARTTTTRATATVPAPSAECSSIQPFSNFGSPQMEKTVSPSVTFELAGASITIPEATITDLWLARAGVGQLQPPFGPTATLEETRAMRIGEAAADGAIFMGIVRNYDGSPDQRLFDLGEATERMSWDAATKWAESKGGSLPTRREQSVMFGNRAPDQYKTEWYWSCEQFAGDESAAWIQNFTDGGQGDGHKSYVYHARAVRRESIR